MSTSPRVGKMTPLYPNPEITRHEDDTPVISPVERLDFYQALQAMLEGNKLTRLEWNNPNEYMFLREVIMIKTKDEINGMFISPGDIEAKDWVIIG